jgi:hypothetical protein
MSVLRFWVRELTFGRELDGMHLPSTQPDFCKYDLTSSHPSTVDYQKTRITSITACKNTHRTLRMWR